MKTRYFLIIALLLSLIVFNQCKKDDISEIPEAPVAIDTLAWKQIEKDSINNGDTNQVMRILSIFSYADSVKLRTPGKEVHPDSNDVDLRKLIRRMYYTLKATGSGVGLAAPQVGINRDIIWVQRLDKTGKPFEYYINPKILLYSNKQVIFQSDGCLSIPGQSGASHRVSTVLVEYYKLDGKRYEEIIEGYSGSNFTSIIFQHEIDHLNSILFIDRLNAKERIEMGRKGYITSPHLM